MFHFEVIEVIPLLISLSYFLAYLIYSQYHYEVSQKYDEMYL